MKPNLNDYEALFRLAEYIRSFVEFQEVQVHFSIVNDGVLLIDVFAYPDDRTIRVRKAFTREALSDMACVEIIMESVFKEMNSQMVELFKSGGTGGYHGTV